VAIVLADGREGNCTKVNANAGCDIDAVQGAGFGQKKNGPVVGIDGAGVKDR
jgi:hypothetical protein